MSGIALFVIAGSRFSYAIVAAGALFWVFILSALVNMVRRGLSSKTRRKMFNVMFSSFAGSLYFFLLYMMNPLLAMETVLICALVPVYFLLGKFCMSLENSDADEILHESVREPLSLGGLTLVFSLIREPLGFATLSLPGGKRGIVELFNTEGAAYTVQIISSSTGALFLLAYILIALRHLDPDKT
jgi:hypothetical protein